jgi:O-antigen ligase
VTEAGLRPLAPPAPPPAAGPAHEPGIGIAVAFVLVALNPGLAGARPWWPGLAWIVFLFARTVLRSAGRGWGDRTALAPLGAVALTYAGTVAVSLALSPALGDALPLVRTLVTGLMLFFVVATSVQTRRQAERVVAGAAAGAVLIGAFAAWQLVQGVGSTAGFFTASGELVGRVSGGFGRANQLGGFLVLVVPLSVAGAFTTRRVRARLLYAGAATLAVVGIYASFSRGALLAIVVVPFVFLRGRWVPVVLAAVVAGLLLATPGLVRDRFARINPEEVAGRVDFWRAAGDIWAAHPALGAGVGAFPQAYAEAPGPEKRYLDRTAFVPPPHAHNLALQLLAEQGVVGLAAFGAVLLAMFGRVLALRRHGDRWTRWMASGLLGALLVFLIHNQLDVTLTESTGIYFWGLLGLVSALSTMSAAGVSEH